MSRRLSPLRLPREVTVIQEGDKTFGVMVCDIGPEKALAVREEIDSMVLTLPKEKQRYWFRRNLEVLERKMRRLLADRGIADTRMRKDIAPPPQIDLTQPKEGNEVQNG